MSNLSLIYWLTHLFMCTSVEILDYYLFYLGSQQMVLKYHSKLGAQGF